MSDDASDAARNGNGPEPEPRTPPASDAPADPTAATDVPAAPASADGHDEQAAPADSDTAAAPGPDGPGGDDTAAVPGRTDETPGSGPAAAGAEAPAEAADTASSGPTADTTVSGSGSGSGDGPADTGSDAPAGPPPPNARSRRRWPRVLAWTAAALAVVLLAGAGTAYAYYRSLRSTMVQHDLGSALEEKDRPPKIGDDLNILFIGSDMRTGKNAEYGGKDFVGERSDSLMLAHVSPDRGMTVVNFPRDSVVQLPECKPYEKAKGTGGYYGMINAALFHGGPPCAVKTVESLTDIRIDHFVHLSFVGFRDMVDAIGGVRMCIPEPMKDERSQLDLKAGEQTLDGQEALSFVRARYEIGDGGDIGRIDRQQIFLSELASQATSSDVLTDPAKLTGLLEAVSEHTSTDSELTLDTMLSLGSTLGDTDLSDITFYTVPWEQAPFDPNRVVWNEEKAKQLFAAINKDEAPDDAVLASGSPAPSASPGAGSSASPSYPAEPSAHPVRPSKQAKEGEGIKGRDATSDACTNGLGEGTEDD